MRGLRLFRAVSLATTSLAEVPGRARPASPVRVIRRVFAVLVLPTAVFTAAAQAQNYTLTVTGAGTGTGAVTAPVAASQPAISCTITGGTAAGSCGGTAALTSGTLTGACGRSVSLTATPAAGYRFGSWTGGSTANPLTLVLSATTVTVTPSFVAQCALTLVVTPANGGTATLTTGTATGDCNRSVTVSAAPNPAFTFTQWSDGVTTPTRATIVGTVSQVLTATFAANAPPPTCTITIGTAPGGTATLTSGTPTGTCGRSITIGTQAESGYRFDAWSDGAVATQYTFAITTPSLTLTPRFLQQCTLALSVSPAEAGAARITTGALSGDCGRSVVIEATSNANFVFVTWSDGSLVSTRTLTISQPQQTLSATLARALVVRVVVSGTLGSVVQLRAGRTACASTEGETEHVCPVNLTAPDTLVAIPTATSGFTGWSGACSGRATCAVTGTESDEVRASFISVPSISADDAAKDLLTGNGLAAAQRDVLDKAGNGDGTFNPGDLIAHLERTNQHVSTTITAQLRRAPARARPTAPRAANTPTKRIAAAP